MLLMTCFLIHFIASRSKALSISFSNTISFTRYDECRAECQSVLLAFQLEFCLIVFHWYWPFLKTQSFDINILFIWHRQCNIETLISFQFYFNFISIGFSVQMMSPKGRLFKKCHKISTWWKRSRNWSEPLAISSATSNIISQWSWACIFVITISETVRWNASHGNEFFFLGEEGGGQRQFSLHKIAYIHIYIKFRLNSMCGTRNWTTFSSLQIFLLYKIETAKRPHSSQENCASKLIQRNSNWF